MTTRRRSAPSARPRRAGRLGAALLAAILALGGGLVPAQPASATALTAPDVLFVHSLGAFLGDATPWLNSLVGPGKFGTLTMFDAEAGTPGTADLVGIEVVMVSTNFDLADTDALGSLLADFVDGGGRVLEMTYGFACTEDTGGPVNWGIGGRWESEGYASLQPSQPIGQACAANEYGNNSTNRAMVVVESTSPFMVGVGAIATLTPPDINLDLQVAPGATLIARWDDANQEPLAVVAPNCSMALNIWPANLTATFYDTVSQASISALVVNLATLACPASSSPPPPPPADPIAVRYTG